MKMDLFFLRSQEIERLKKVPFAELIEKLSGAEGFYDEYLFSIPPAET